MKFLGTDLDVTVLKLRNSAKTFVTTFSSSITADRTITLQDKDGVIAYLSDISTSGYSGDNVMSNVGVTSKLVSELIIKAGTYSSFKAIIGTDNGSTTAYLIIKKSDNTVLKTLNNTSVPIEVSTTGFTLASDTLCGIYLYGGTDTTTSIVTNWSIS
jgi:hypothetical protein